MVPPLVAGAKGQGQHGARLPMLRRHRLAGVPGSHTDLHPPLGLTPHLLQSPQKCDVIEVMNEMEPLWPGTTKFFATSPLGSPARTSRC